MNFRYFAVDIPTFFYFELNPMCIISGKFAVTVMLNELLLFIYFFSIAT